MKDKLLNAQMLLNFHFIYNYAPFPAIFILWYLVASPISWGKKFQSKKESPALWDANVTFFPKTATYFELTGRTVHDNKDFIENWTWLATCMSLAQCPEPPLLPYPATLESIHQYLEDMTEVPIASGKTGD